VSTIWLSLGMAATGVVQFIHTKEEEQQMKTLGYPMYLMTIIAVWKFAGVMAILLPKFPLVKEWAYAGFFFLMSGAIFSHLAAGDKAVEYFGPSLLLLLTIISWYFRPRERKIIVSI